MTALAIELARHVGQHRLTLTAPDKLRCLDCQQTIDLRPALTAVPGHTSTSRGHPHRDEACRLHGGEWPDMCGRCRSDRLVDGSEQPR